MVQVKYHFVTKWFCEPTKHIGRSPDDQDDASDRAGLADHSWTMTKS
jgi:hypothetical protein